MTERQLQLLTLCIFVAGGVHLGCPLSAGQAPPAPTVQGTFQPQHAPSLQAQPWSSAVPAEWQDALAVQYLLFSYEMQEMLVGYLAHEHHWPDSLEHLLAAQPPIFLPATKAGVLYRLEGGPTGPEVAAAPGTIRIALTADTCSLQFFYEADDLTPAVSRMTSTVNVLKRSQLELRAAPPVIRSYPRGWEGPPVDRTIATHSTLAGNWYERARKAWEHRLRWFVYIHGRLPASLQELLESQRSNLVPSASQVEGINGFLTQPGTLYVELSYSTFQSRIYSLGQHASKPIGWEHTWRLGPGSGVVLGQPRILLAASDDSCFQPFALIRLPEFAGQE